MVKGLTKVKKSLVKGTTFSITLPFEQNIKEPKSQRKIPINKNQPDPFTKFDSRIKSMVQKILQDLKPKHKVLLTGSPAEFNRLKKEGKKYAITYICGNELMDNDVFSDVEMDVVSTTFKKNARQSLCEMLDHAKKKNKDLTGNAAIKHAITVPNVPTIIVTVLAIFKPFWSETDFEKRW